MLHAAALSGAPMIAFDNVKRGGVVQSMALDRFTTSIEVSDRELGHSRMLNASAAIPIAFTGNAISVAGDTASRTLIVHIDANRVDPENRPYRHRDILGWIIVEPFGNSEEIVHHSTGRTASCRCRRRATDGRPISSVVGGGGPPG